MSWREERKLVTLPTKGSETPEIVLARTLEKARAGRIKQVAIAIVWDDEQESVACDYSEGKLSSILYAAVSLDIEIRDAMRSVWRPTDEIAEPPEVS